MTLPISSLSGLSEARGHHFYARNLKKDSIVVDLGSHLGEFSVALSDTFGCRCYAVEALPSLYEKIPDNDSIKKLNYAIADTEGEVSFCVSKNPEGNHLSNLNSSFDLSEETIPVKGTTLSHLVSKEKIKNISLLKVDIEGSEVALFDSTPDHVLSDIDQISVEFHDFMLDIRTDVERIMNRLKSLGFICVRYSFHTNGDVLFLNRQRLGIGSLEHLYIRLLSRYSRGLSRVIGKVLRSQV